jgi:hypothetical protein
MTESRWYGVSSGDGNNGVSHTFADYYVKTDEPWRLAELAALTTFKKGEGVDWARENMAIDGEAEYVIGVTFLESLETQEARDEAQSAVDSAENTIEAYSLGEVDEEELTRLNIELESAILELDNFEDTGPAWLIFEVFPCDPDEQREGRPTYESLEEAFGEDCALVASEKETESKIDSLRAAL